MSAIAVRDAHAEDHPHVAALFLELATNEAPPSRERFATVMQPATLVAERDGEIVGYLYYEILADSGYVRHVATAPEARRAGVASALFAHAKERFRRRGCASARLNVRPDNAPAIALYLREGLRPAYGSTALRFSLRALPGEPAADAAPRLVAPAEDAGVEARLGIASGQLASARARPSVVVVGLERAGEIAAVACFDRTFPGAFPFRVAEPRLGLALVDACRMHALEDTLQVVVEDDPALAALLVARGAERTLEIVHYVGPLDGA